MNKNSFIEKKRLARLLALQYLFTLFQSERDKKKYKVFEPKVLLEILEEKAYDKKLYENLIEGVTENLEEIDILISKYAQEWPIDQINLVSLTVLRLAIWEGFLGKINPPKVAINEAIEMEKNLNSKTSSEFVNGVLGKIILDFNL